MRAAVITIFPEVIRAAMAEGVVARAVREGRLDIDLVNPREHTSDRRRNVDDRPFGGGPGMVMLAAPLASAVATARESLPSSAPVILLSPQGERFRQQTATELAESDGFVLVAGRYEGIDERFVEQNVDREISIGDYVLSGGELPALVVIDAVARLLPGALGNPASVLDESHVDGLLDWPHYTRPEIHAGRRVPPVLLSGNHAEVARWRRREALGRTWQRRPELLLDRDISSHDRTLLAEYIAEQPAAAAIAATSASSTNTQGDEPNAPQQDH